MRRPLLLWGFMATGKSTVGPLVATRAGVPFVDLDAVIEARAGRSIAELFATDGEGAFRALEGEALEAQLADPTPRVVALGGGALLLRALRLKALDRAVVVALSADSRTVGARAGSSGARPLLAGDPVARAAALMELRAPAYAEAPVQIRTDNQTPQAVADAVHAAWLRDEIAVAAGTDSYGVAVGREVAAGFAARVAQGASGVLLVSDETVAALHAAPIHAALRDAGAPVGECVLRPGEEHKTVQAAESVWEAARCFGLDRSGLVLALGGGVVTDVAGFAAATWMRGIPWAALPTTLLAMVDASVGGKTAVDFSDAKNAVGAFWQPRAVTCDVSFTRTEAERGYVSALAEVIKTALIGDADLFAWLEREASAVLARDAEVLAEVVRRCLRVKARVVSQDPREGGVRATLNLGHTIGHALEVQAGYRGLSHGEAVALGLVAAVELGQRRGITPQALVERVRSLLSTYGLPHQLPENLVAAGALIARDKKRVGSDVRFVWLHDVGDVRVGRIALDQLQRDLSDLV